MSPAEQRATEYQKLSAWYANQARVQLDIELAQPDKNEVDERWNAMVGGQEEANSPSSIVGPILIGAAILAAIGWLLGR